MNYVLSSLIYNCQNLETNKISISGRMEQKMWYISTKGTTLQLKLRFMFSNTAEHSVLANDNICTQTAII